VVDPLGGPADAGALSRGLPGRRRDLTRRGRRSPNSCFAPSIFPGFPRQSNLFLPPGRIFLRRGRHVRRGRLNPHAPRGRAPALRLQWASGIA